MADFEKGFDDVRKEFLALRGRGGFQVSAVKNKQDNQGRIIPRLC